MNKKALAALLIAVLLPFTGYWIVNYYSKRVASMPPRYFYDSVITTRVNGKQTFDTLWHQVKGPMFRDQFGKPFSISDIHNRAIVLNFFFSRCPTVCPGLTRNMKKLQDSFKGGNDTIVQFISVSVDPEHDSTERLRAFADNFNVNHDNWAFVNGDKKEIYNFAFSEMKASIADTEVDSAFIHTENFFLLDAKHVIRGWYNGFDTIKLAKLAGDIPLLMLEKDKSKPTIFYRFVPILPLIFGGIAFVIIIMLVLNNKRKKD